MGSVGLLSDWIREAGEEAILIGDTEIGKKHFKLTKPKQETLALMSAEMQLYYDRSQLADTRKSKSSQKSTKRKGRVGQRKKNQRDKAGLSA